MPIATRLPVSGRRHTETIEVLQHRIARLEIDNADLRRALDSTEADLAEARAGHARALEQRIRTMGFRLAHALDTDHVLASPDDRRTAARRVFDEPRYLVFDDTPPTIHAEPIPPGHPDYVDADIVDDLDR